MRPIARHLARHGRRRGLAVWTVGYRYRGWNGTDASPVADTEWALDEVRRRHGDVPIVVIGHSMGGRTALRVVGHDLIKGVVALAPWTPAEEPVEQLAGKAVLIAHGSLDVVTSPRASRRYAERARRVTDRVWWICVRGDIHALVLRWHTWHGLATGFALYCLGWDDLPRRVRASACAQRT
jgi:dienelactone hydrolase